MKKRVPNIVEVGKKDRKKEGRGRGGGGRQRKRAGER